MLFKDHQTTGLYLLSWYQHNPPGSFWQTSTLLGQQSTETMLIMPTKAPQRRDQSEKEKEIKVKVVLHFEVFFVLHPCSSFHAIFTNRMLHWRGLQGSAESCLSVMKYKKCNLLILIFFFNEWSSCCFFFSMQVINYLSSQISLDVPVRKHQWGVQKTAAIQLANISFTLGFFRSPEHKRMSGTA